VKNPNRNDDRTPIFGGAEKVRQREDWVGEGFKRREREREKKSLATSRAEILRLCGTHYAKP